MKRRLWLGFGALAIVGAWSVGALANPLTRGGSGLGYYRGVPYFSQMVDLMNHTFGSSFTQRMLSYCFGANHGPTARGGRSNGSAPYYGGMMGGQLP